MDKFRVCGITSEGYPQVEHSGLTLEQAQATMQKLKTFFPDVDFYIDVAPDEQGDNVRGKSRREMADGWEDFYPDSH